MKEFFDRMRSQLLPGTQISDLEQNTIEAVVKRMREALGAGRGIRLSKDELRILSLYGLKTQLDAEEDLPFDGRPH
ncbi:hypothetical protein [Aeoliella sp. SH292]|uniref:hypothetical protein n=1 Tax=Aeoliella sp. SH292 TaxID=3454464 RepID=UPI003F98AA3F